MVRVILSETDIDDAELFEEDEFRFLNGMIGIAYQQNIGLHTFEENEEQRYIKFVRLESSAPFLSQLLALRVNAVHGPVWIATDI